MFVKHKTTHRNSRHVKCMLSKSIQRQIIENRCIRLLKRRLVETRLFAVKNFHTSEKMFNNKYKKVEESGSLGPDIDVTVLQFNVTVSTVTVTVSNNGLHCLSKTEKLLSHSLGPAASLFGCVSFHTVMTT